jgi:hypothetical protein
MSTGSDSLSFFVKVEGRAYSNHRNPEGIYGVEVIAERTAQHSACAALSIAQDSVPFLSENPHGFTLRVFNTHGEEVLVPQPLMTRHETRGLFCGRSKNPPKSITLQ